MKKISNQSTFLTCLIALLLQTATSAQTFSNKTVIDGTTAKAVTLAAEQEFNGDIPSVAYLRASTAAIDKTGDSYKITLSSQSRTGLKVESTFRVRPLSGEVSRTNTLPSASSKATLKLPGTYVAALVLGNSAFMSSSSLRKPSGEISELEVQINTPYENLPDIVYVAYRPKGYNALSATLAPSTNKSTVMLGCDPTIDFSVNISTHLVTALKPVC
ncbi:MAG TPA: hypothetical protein VIG32_11560 [Candidatus Baltobacteraceae bacterium]